MRDQTKRLGKIDRALESMPVTGAAVSTALEVFRQTGQLPDHDRLAERAIEETLRLPRPKSTREILLREATHSFEPVRMAARTVLSLLVQAGQNVASRNFVDEGMALPEFGSIGLHLLGWPEILIKAPYEAQAERVIGQVKKLRPWLNLDPTRIGKIATFAARFFKTGELPSEERMSDAVLLYAEFLALHRILGGEEDAEVLAAFDSRAGTQGDDRDTLPLTSCERWQPVVASRRGDDLTHPIRSCVVDRANAPPSPPLRRRQERDNGVDGCIIGFEVRRLR